MAHQDKAEKDLKKGKEHTPDENKELNEQNANNQDIEEKGSRLAKGKTGSGPKNREWARRRRPTKREKGEGGEGARGAKEDWENDEACTKTTPNNRRRITMIRMRRTS
jgi:hypothetical protein